jgi:hypothetical protein
VRPQATAAAHRSTAADLPARADGGSDGATRSTVVARPDAVSVRLRAPEHRPSRATPRPGGEKALVRLRNGEPDRGEVSYPLGGMRKSRD